MDVHKSGGYTLIRYMTKEKTQPIVCLADIHLGHKNFNQSVLDKVIKWIIDNNALWFGGGDLIENSTKHSVGAGWAEQILNPQQQLDKIVQLLLPIAPQCLGVLNGNHEDRTFRDTGLNPTQSIASALRVPYCGDEIFIVIANDRKVYDKGRAYTIYGCHTKSANKTAGLAFNGMQNNMGWILTDVVCKAHGHDMGLSPPSIRLSVDPQNNSITENYTYYWLVGHYLDRPDSYIAKRSGQPKLIGTEALMLNMHGAKRIESYRIPL